MSKAGKFNVMSFVLTIVVIFIAGMLSSIIFPYLPLNDGWIKGIIGGIVAMALLSVFGLLTGKLNLWMLLTGGIAIFVGGIAGQYLVSWVNLGGIYGQVIVIAIQALVLTMLGFVKGGKKGF